MCSVQGTGFYNEHAGSCQSVQHFANFEVLRAWGLVELFSAHLTCRVLDGIEGIDNNFKR